MPILEINILGSNIEISYQEGEKEKLLYLVKQFKLRLSKFENLKVRFADFKIILLAALKAEDIIYELNQTIENQNKVIKSSTIQQEQIDNFRIKMLESRRDLRKVQRSLRNDVETLENRIRIINIWAVPIVVAIISILLALVRRFRRAQFYKSAIH